MSEHIDFGQEHTAFWVDHPASGATNIVLLSGHPSLVVNNRALLAELLGTYSFIVEHTGLLCGTYSFRGCAYRFRGGK